MTKKRVLALLTLALFVPSVALAAQFKTGDSPNVSASETINDDLYITGGDVSVDGTVNGDVIAAGGMVTVTGTVKGDLIVAGGSLNLRGTVEDDLRAAGGSIRIGGKVNDDLIVGGGDVRIERDSTVGGDTKLGGGQVAIAGKTNTVEAAVGKLTVANTAEINGDLRYWSDEKISVAEGAKISGTTEQKMVERKDEGEGKWRKGGVGVVLGIIGTALFAWLFSLIVSNKTHAVAETMKAQFGPNLLWGFLSLIAIPAAAIILMITVIGLPIGILTMLAFPLIVYLGWLMTVLTVGYWVYRWITKQEKVGSWVYALVGAVVLVLLGFIPVLGWIVVALVFLASLGGMLRLDWQAFQKLRHDKAM